MKQSSSPIYAVALIVPLYNTEKYIAECIQSIKNQSYSNFFCVIVNDGSTDSSQLQAKKAIDNDPRFVLINKNNTGVSNTRNVALEYLEKLDKKIDYIGFVDSDDVIEADFIEKLLNAIIENQADCASCGVATKYVDKIESSDNKFIKYKKINHEQIIQHSLAVGEFEKHADLCSFPGLCNKLFKADKVLGHRFNEKKKNSEDILFFLEIYENLSFEALVNDYLYLYRMRKSSATHLISMINQIKKDVEIFEYILEAYDNQNLKTAVTAKLYQALYRGLIESIFVDEKLAKTYFLKLKSLYKKDKNLCPKKYIRKVKRLKLGWYFNKIYIKIRSIKAQKKKASIDAISNMHQLYD